MIAQAQVEKVRRLLAEGRHSQRQIAALTGVSRGTVGVIAAGKRTDRVRRPTDDWDERRGPLMRCAGCGARVFSPCRLCRIRELKAAELLDRRQAAGRDPADRNDARRSRLDPTHILGPARRS